MSVPLGGVLGHQVNKFEQVSSEGRGGIGPRSGGGGEMVSISQGCTPRMQTLLHPHPRLDADPPPPWSCNTSVSVSVLYLFHQKSYD